MGMDGLDDITNAQRGGRAEAPSAVGGVASTLVGKSANGGEMQQQQQQQQQQQKKKNCAKCKLGKGRCRKPNQPGHLCTPAGAAELGGGGSADANAKPTRPAKQRQEKSAPPDESIVGSRCAVEWGPGEIYEGVVKNVDVDLRGRSKVLVQYDDGDKQWEFLHAITLLPTPPSAGGGSGKRLVESLKIAGASDEAIARALQQEDQTRKSGRERRIVVHREPPGTSGEPQFARKPKSEVSCRGCKSLYSHLDLGVTAAEAAAMRDWTCGVCLGTHVKHWRKSRAYESRDFSRYKQIRGEQWSEKQPMTFIPPAGDIRVEGPGISPGSWSVTEDEMLRTMCLTEGTGEWESKAARFTAGNGRTASSLRQRWAKLREKEENAAAKPAGRNPAKSCSKASKSKAGSKRSREELVAVSEERNCKTCRIGKGQCRHWDTRGHLQSR